MSVHHTLRFAAPLTKIEIEVRLERQAPSNGQLDTQLQPVTGAYNRLSISMGSWERRGPRGPWREATFGQGINEVETFAREHLPEAKQADVLRLCALWREWHLNDLQAGTEAQAAAVKAGRIDGTVQDYPFYETATAHLASVGLLEDNGYRYGAKWLVRRLPQAVQAEVLTLCERLLG